MKKHLVLTFVATLLTAMTLSVAQAALITGIGDTCLDVPDGDTTDGTPVQIFHCHGSFNQQWNIVNGQIIGIGGVLDVAGAALPTVPRCNSSRVMAVAINAGAWRVGALRVSARNAWTCLMAIRRIAPHCRSSRVMAGAINAGRSGKWVPQGREARGGFPASSW